MTDRDQAVLVPEMMSHGKRPPIRALTSIRFFAAMYVVTLHTNVASLPGMPTLAAQFFSSGYTAVTLFFALSGFILAYNYPHVISSAEFWISRFARIYPVYLVALLLSFALILSRRGVPRQPGLVPALICSILLIQSWIPSYATMINALGWTLSVEALFYATFPFLNRFCRRPARMVVVLFVAIYLGMVLTPVAIAHYNAATGIRLAVFMDLQFPFFRLGTFILGMLAGARFARNPRSFAGLLPLSLLATLLLLVWLPADLYRPLKTMLLSCSYTGVLFAIAHVNRGPLVNRWLLLCGEISYSIYLIQFLVFHAWHAMVLRLFHVELQPIFFVPFLLLVSYLSFRFIEVPARSVVRNFGLRMLRSK